MKNEDKIVELLAETLLKQDRQEALLEKHGALLEKHGAILEKLVVGQEKHGAILEKLVVGQEKHGAILEKLVVGQEKHATLFETMTYELKGLREDFHKMNDHLLIRQEKMEERISRLEDKVFKS